MEYKRAVSGIRPHDSKINAVARLVDAVIIGVTLAALVSMMRASWEPVFSWLLLFSIVLFSFFSEANSSYRSWRGESLAQEIQAILVSWLWIVLFLVIFDVFFYSGSFLDSKLILCWFLLTPIELISWHSIVRMSLNFARDSGANTRTVAIIGATQLGVTLRDKIERTPWEGQTFIGFYDDRVMRPGRRVSVPAEEVLGGIDDLIEACKAGQVDIVYVALPMKSEERIKQIFSSLADTTVSVFLMLDLFSFDLLNSRWMDIQGMPAVSIYESPHVGIDSVTKRAFDLAVGFTILAMIAIPMLFIAIGVKLSSPGPVFFKQKRYGVNGEPIKVWKFRSMKVMDAGDGEVKQATKGDSRITRFGAFLRGTSLDELPQFFNVITGSMSIVGPRPHAVSHNEQYRGEIHGYMLRHKVKPGITGWAQINGFRGETDTLDKMEGRIHYDLEYIHHWSVWLDVKIIFLTIFRSFTDKNAY